MVNPKLFEKAVAFTDAALTLIDDDGYPFSIPVSFEVDGEASNSNIKTSKFTES